MISLELTHSLRAAPRGKRGVDEPRERLSNLRGNHGVDKYSTVRWHHSTGGRRNFILFSSILIVERELSRRIVEKERRSLEYRAGSDYLIP